MTLTTATMVQDNEGKTISVLAASYAQGQIISDKANDISNDVMQASLAYQQILTAQLEQQAKLEAEKAAAAKAAAAKAAAAKAAAAKTSTTTKTTESATTTTTSTDYYVKTYKITHYCGCSKCNPGNAGRTASGKTLKIGMVAMLGVPFGTIVEINGTKYVVEDRCASSSVIDIYVSSHSEALQKGTYTAQVKIYK